MCQKGDAENLDLCSGHVKELPYGCGRPAAVKARAFVCGVYL